MKLAAEWDIKEYACPAGGCLLTDPIFARKMKDLMDDNIDFTLNDVHFLKIGRHLRIAKKTKAVMGRNKKENEKLMSFVQDGDYVIEKNGIPGPITVVRGEVSEDIKQLAASITAAYGKGNNSDSIEVTMKKAPDESVEIIRVIPHTQKEVAKYLI